MREFKIKKAEIENTNDLYNIALNSPELQTSATEVFMEKNDFKALIKYKNGVFLVAFFENQIIGFIYADFIEYATNDKNKYACIMYLTVIKEYRNKGIAKLLYDNCVKRLQEKGCTHLYAWVKDEEPITKFMKKQKFTEGKKYVWMDRKL